MQRTYISQITLCYRLLNGKKKQHLFGTKKWRAYVEGDDIYVIDPFEKICESGIISQDSSSVIHVKVKKWGEMIEVGNVGGDNIWISTDGILELAKKISK